LNLCY